MSKSTSELQTRQPHLDHLDLARLLRRRVAGEPFPHSFIHDADVCFAPPEDLVRGREHAPGTDHGDNEGLAWYFCSLAHYHESTGGGSARRRRRQVCGGAVKTCWHPETGKKPILGPDKKSVGAYKSTLSYVSKIKNPPGAPKPFRNKTLGWILVEIGLEQQDEDDTDQQLVLCKVYRSPRRDPETSTEVSSAGAEDVGPAAIRGVSEGGVILDEPLDVPGGDMPAPPPASCDYNLHSPGVVRNPALLIAPPSKHGSLAIVNKSNAAATVVMKFGGSSIPSAERMKEMAKLVLSLESPVVVLSAMGNTTTNILLAAWKAMTCGARKASEIHELAITKELHLRTIDELGLDRSIVSGSSDELELHLQYVAMTKELTPRTRDYLVFFGERTSTKIFFEYLNKLGKGTLQEWELHPVTTFGRVGSDLTAAIIGRDFGSAEIQVWKDQDSIFTCDPNVCAKAIPLPCLTFDEAAEIGFFAAQSMQIAMEGGIKVIVKNSYNPQARGTVITKTRDMSKSTLTSIVLKSNITILDIERTSSLNQDAFVVKAISIFQNFEYLGISVDWVAASEGKMSFTLVPSKLLSQELIQPALDNAVEELKKIATVDRLQDRSVISLVGIPQMSTVILLRTLDVLRSSHVAFEKVSQGSSKVSKVSLMVHDSEAKDCVQALHSAFFEDGFVSEVQGAENECAIPVNSPAAASSSGVSKRKAGDYQPEAPPGVRQLHRSDTDPDGRPEETEPQLSSDPVPVGGDNDWDEFFMFYQRRAMGQLVVPRALC